MNEQIRELAEQAGYESTRWTTTVEFEQFMETFSKSIIKECIKKYDEYGLYSSDQRSFIIAGHNLKKHFGLGNHD